MEEKIIRGLKGFADALESGEDLAERFTCRKVVLNLEPVSYSPDSVKKTRETLGLSQALFAKFIGASKNAVQAWERGDREPSPIACRFMDEIMNNPQLFRRRFADLATPTGAR
ncbi:MAG: helix-turn-helix domain-containing protein [Pirellulales bacterium]|nr:helix-turn-helix domain-containing protein [Pirellulales bacterium]